MKIVDSFADGQTDNASCKVSIATKKVNLERFVLILPSWYDAQGWQEDLSVEASYILDLCYTTEE